MNRLRAALVAAFLPSAALADAAYLGSYHWTYPKDYFSGLSGLEIAPGGTRFLAIGDAGQIIKGDLIRENGRVVGVIHDNVRGLKRPEGGRVRGNANFDAEGLAGDPDGRFYVSFEHDARVWAYDRWLGRATPLPSHPDFALFASNRGPEALAIAPDGTLYLLPEGPAEFLGDRHLYRFQNETWERLGPVETDALFWPVGADIAPDGLFYLLERRYVPALGFSSRVRRFRIGAEGLSDPETLLTTGFGVHDNLEGIAVWTREDGRLGLTLLSDDNNRRLQRTELVDYVLPQP